jgi:hypothetical protein
MIRPLRVAHRRIFGILAVALPVTIAAGLVARRPQESHLAEVKSEPAQVLKRVPSQKRAFALIFRRDSGSQGGIRTVLQASTSLNEPDLLAYWTNESRPGEALPAGSVLLGAVVPGRVSSVSLPEGQEGRVVLYSLAHHEVVDSAVPGSRP